MANMTLGSCCRVSDSTLSRVALSYGVNGILTCCSTTCLTGNVQAQFLADITLC